MEALLMKYEGFVSISYGMLCAQFEWIYYRRAQVENIFRNKYLKLSEHYKNQKPLWLKNVPKGTYKLLLCRKISKIFYCNPRGRSPRNILYTEDCRIN